MEIKLFKKVYIITFKFLLLVYFMTVGLSVSHCQTPARIKKSNYDPQFTINDPGQTNVFVKNNGQFDFCLKSKEKVNFAINSGDQVFFTPNGYVWKLSKINEEKSWAVR